MVLLDAEWPAFCAGYGLDWSTRQQSEDDAGSARLEHHAHLTIFDGVARHSEEGAEFVRRSQEIGFREAVRARDRPFGDYGERQRE